MSLSRRQFLAHSAAATALAAVSGPATTFAAEENPPLIDCHQHLWDLTKFKLPWIEPGTLLAKSYVSSDYAAAIAGTGITQAVYMEVDVAEEQQRAEAEHLTELCKSAATPTIAAVVSGRPAAENLGDYLAFLKRSPYIKGIRQVLHAPSAKPGLCLTEAYVRGVRLLGKEGLSFDLCMRPGELADGAKLAELCPDTRFILDHCGNADPKAWIALREKGKSPDELRPDHAIDSWKRDLEKVAAQPNVICKISGIIARVPDKAKIDWSADDLAPIINHCLDAFGPDRVIFGSDWPVCLLGAPLAQWVSALKQIVAKRPLAERKKLFSENAKRFYGLA